MHIPPHGQITRADRRERRNGGRDISLEVNIKRIKEGGGGILACMENSINIIP
jgi:hypothetical protein